MRLPKSQCFWLKALNNFPIQPALQGASKVGGRCSMVSMASQWPSCQGQGECRTWYALRGG